MVRGSRIPTSLPSLSESLHHGGGRQVILGKTRAERRLRVSGTLAGWEPDGPGRSRHSEASVGVSGLTCGRRRPGALALPASALAAFVMRSGGYLTSNGAST